MDSFTGAILLIVILTSFISGFLLMLIVKRNPMPTIDELPFFHIPYSVCDKLSSYCLLILIDIVLIIFYFAFIIAVLLWTPVIKFERKRRANRLWNK